MPAPEPGAIGVTPEGSPMALSTLLHIVLEKVGGTEVADVLSRPLMIELIALIPDILARFQKPVLRNLIYALVGIPSFILAILGDKVGLNIELRKDLGLLGSHEILNIVRDIAHPLGLSALSMNWEEIQKSLSLGDPISVAKSLSYLPDILEKAGVSLAPLTSIFGKKTLAMPKPTTTEKTTLTTAPVEFKPVSLEAIETKPIEEKKKKVVWRFGIRD